MDRGALIVLEGLDRSGKSSQVKNILKELSVQNIPAERMCFPDRTTFMGKVIDSYLKAETNLTDQALHLLFSANRWECLAKMEDLLLKGTTLVVDRYSYSGVAYSFAKGGSLDLEWCKSPERGLLKPDLVLYLDIDINILRRRKGFGEERFEEENFQKSVDKAFKMLIDDNWKIIDADIPESDLTKLLMKYVLDRITDVRNKPISKLW